MAFNEQLAQRIRTALTPLSAKITEKKMFGGLSFLYGGRMSVGIVGDELCVRVVSERFAEPLQQPFVREMNFTGKAMKDFVFVADEAFATEEQLMHWINLGIEHAQRAVKGK